MGLADWFRTFCDNIRVRKAATISQRYKAMGFGGGFGGAAPTIVDGLGLTDTRTRFQGTSLLPAVFEAASLPRTLYAHTRGIAPSDRPAKPWFTLRDGPYKIVFGESASSAELFDLARDAAEQNNLASTDRLQTQYLVQELLLQRYRNLEILSASGGAEIAPLNEEMIRGLRALGYVR